jgi:hypothetical protein
MSVEGNVLTVKVDLSKEFGPSSSGKTIIIASTEGNVSIPGAEDKKIGLNVYRKKWKQGAWNIDTRLLFATYCRPRDGLGPSSGRRC